jgi:hypothetical protein
MYSVGKLVPLVYLISLKFAPYANIFLKFIHNFDTGTLVSKRKFYIYQSKKKK